MKLVSFTSRRLLYCVAFVIISLVVKHADSVTTVNPETGGYSFTLAIEESVPEPATADALETYISNIRTTLQNFNIQLFLSTNGYFHLDDVQILLPASWTGEATSEFQFASTESYSTSDIRLSTRVSAPYVANPHLCGHPGQYIELPHTFLSGEQADPTYGSLVKSLLTQWARFRWGVWEEHGYPAMGKFPYFYRPNPVNIESWEPTSCSNTALQGEYRTVGSNTPCEAPEEDCRFHPSPTSTATSSLMGYHWLESVTHFCNKDTHNQLAPNKQNLYCNYRSVWEVIESSPDYNEIEPLGEILVPNVKVVKTSNYPALHVLIDRGHVEDQNNLIILNHIIPNLAQLFDVEGQANDNAVASLSVFDDDGFQTLVPWKTIRGNEDEFHEKLGDVKTEYETFRDFSSALLDVANSVESLSSKAGAVVLVVKTGGVQTYYGSLQPEEEVSAALSKANVKLFAAEVRNTADLPFVNLKTVAERTGGKHGQFDNPATAAEQIIDIVNEIRTILNTPTEPVPITQSTQVLFRGKLTPAESKSIIQPSGISSVKVHVTVPDGTVPVLQVGGAELPGNSRNEWDEESEPTRRVVYTFDVPEDVQGNLQVQYTCDGCNELFEARVLIAGQPSESSVFEDVEVFITTSAINNVVEFSQTSQPFAIYATVLFRHMPVKDAIVQATFRDYHGTEDIVDLLDDGTGFPDLEQGDGVYSGVHIPLVDGVYKVSVKVESRSESERDALSYVSRIEASRLLPVDQEYIDCEECEPVSLDVAYTGTFDVSDITFDRVGLFPRGPAKILDLSAVVLLGDDPSDTRLRLTFSSPKILGVSNSSATASRYYILGSNSFATLTSKGGQVVQGITNVSPAGSEESVQIVAPPGVGQNFYFSYYIVHSVYTDYPYEVSVLSNIAQLVYRNLSDEPTTEGSGEDSTTPGEDTTTTTTPSTTTTTNGPGTDEEDDDKSFFKKAGGIVVIVLIVLVVGGAIGGGAYYFMKKKRNSQQLLDEDNRI